MQPERAAIFFIQMENVALGRATNLQFAASAGGISEIKKKGGVSVGSKTLFAAGARVRERMRPT